MKRFVRFFTIADFVEEENWLREQRKKGLKIVKFSAPCFYTFEEVEPEDYIYRLEFNNSKTEDDRKKMYQDYGWDYCNSFMGWNYFCKKASEVTKENDGELFSDKESKIAMLEKITQKRLLPLVCIFLCCIIPNMRLLFSHSRNVFDIILGGVFGVMFLVYVFLITYCGIKLKKMKKDFEN